MVRVGGGTEKRLQNSKMRKEGKEGEEGRGGVKKHSSPSPAPATGPERNPGTKRKPHRQRKKPPPENPNETASGELLVNVSAPDIG
jgi:hypothetical protein